MTDSMGPGKLVRHMQNPSYTYWHIHVADIHGTGTKHKVRHRQKSVVQWSFISKFACINNLITLLEVFFFIVIFFINCFHLSYYADITFRETPTCFTRRWVNFLVTDNYRYIFRLSHHMASSWSRVHFSHWLPHRKIPSAFYVEKYPFSLLHNAWQGKKLLSEIINEPFFLIPRYTKFLASCRNKSKIIK